MKSNCKVIQLFKSFYKYIEAWLQQYSVFSIKKRIENYYEDTINGIEGDKDALEMELHRVKYIYNVLNGFASNFVWLFLSGFVGYLFKIQSVKATVINFIMLAIIFLMILACQWFFLCKANTAYEKMKVVKAELKKINDTVQPNPKKISIRISNCNLVRRSVFGR